MEHEWNHDLVMDALVTVFSQEHKRGLKGGLKGSLRGLTEGAQGLKRLLGGLLGRFNMWFIGGLLRLYEGLTKLLDKRKGGGRGFKLGL